MTETRITLADLADPQYAWIRNHGALYTVLSHLEECDGECKGDDEDDRDDRDDGIRIGRSIQTVLVPERPVETAEQLANAFAAVDYWGVNDADIPLIFFAPLLTDIQWEANTRSRECWRDDEIVCGWFMKPGGPPELEWFSPENRPPMRQTLVDMFDDIYAMRGGGGGGSDDVTAPPTKKLPLDTFAAKHGLLQILRYLGALAEIDSSPHKMTAFHVCVGMTAAVNGHDNCLAHILRQWEAKNILPKSALSDLLGHAITSGNLRCVQLVDEYDSGVNRWVFIKSAVVSAAAANTCVDVANRLAILQYLHITRDKHRKQDDDEPPIFGRQSGLVSFLMILATRQHEVLRFVVDHLNGTWSTQVAAAAALNGNLQSLQFAHQSGCPWDEDTCRCAAYSGSIKCLVYARENGCPWTGRTILAAASGQIRSDNYPSASAVGATEFSVGAHLECLEYALSHDCPLDGSHTTTAVLAAAQSGNGAGLSLLAKHGVAIPPAAYLATFSQRASAAGAKGDNPSAARDSCRRMIRDTLWPNEEGRNTDQTDAPENDQ